MRIYTVYVKTDDSGRVTAVQSSAFLEDAQGWTAVDAGEGDRYAHAQGNYLEQPIRDVRGICRYALVNGALRMRTQEEMDAEYVPPEAGLSAAQRLDALEEELAAAKILLGLA